ncbi:MAG: hypothetical protein JO235_13730 [Chroococcidiopsidaceae cyanobacterium CP_BM_RX_35]|nr:hypothetical protein [Chroococcidiopsidaceae cyanobacterium CP_BM_RX_35]
MKQRSGDTAPKTATFVNNDNNVDDAVVTAVTEASEYLRVVVPKQFAT